MDERALVAQKEHGALYDYCGSTGHLMKKCKAVDTLFMFIDAIVTFTQLCIYVFEKLCFREINLDLERVELSSLLQR